MLEILLPAVILAKIKHYKLKYLFSSWAFYPILVSQLFLIFMQINVFAGNYYVLKYIPAIKMAIPLSYIFSILLYQLYRPAFIGCGFILLGTVLNRFVIWQNGGKMPVFPSLSYVTGYVRSNTFDANSGIHILGNIYTKFAFLSDYIDVGYSVLSPGDLLIHFFSFLMLYYTIRAVHLHYSPALTQIKV